MDTQLTQALTFLAWSGAGFLIIIGLFVAKLLFDLSCLTTSIKKSADIVQEDLKPIMKNVSEATTTINDVVQSANKKVSKLNEVYDKASDIIVNVISKASSITGFALKELLKGFCAGFKSMFTKN